MSVNMPACAGAPSPVVNVFVPADSFSVAMGADQVARLLELACRERGLAVKIVRNGSRGLAWLEPLVEVATPAGRIAYGPVNPQDVDGLLDAGLLAGAPHPLAQGPTEAIPFLARQQRQLFARVGVIDPLSLTDYANHGGWAGLKAALAMAPDAIVDTMVASGLRGRGGAAFPTGIKWRTVAGAAHGQKYVVCNADEGDSGSFADRMLIEGDPFQLIEGMTIAALATGASRGFIYLRSEYPLAARVLDRALSLARAASYLGDDLLASGRAFDIELRIGAGSYVCGEETAMLESLEGRRGVVRAKPPLPALSGLFGRPSVINNVLTLACVPAILAHGADWYRQFGVGRSTGTMPFQLAGNVRFGGLVEIGFGVSLRELMYGFGGGTASGRALKAVQVGGPLGAYLAPAHWDLPIDYETYAAAGAVLGHGSIVMHDDSANMAALARYAMAFCALESCGKCTPCRIGSVRGVEVIDSLVAGRAPARQAVLLRDLCSTMVDGSLCAMGGMTPFPVLSALDLYPRDFGLTADTKVTT